MLIGITQYELLVKKKWPTRDLSVQFKKETIC